MPEGGVQREGARGRWDKRGRAETEELRQRQPAREPERGWRAGQGEGMMAIRMGNPEYFFKEEAFHLALEDACGRVRCGGQGRAW